jgi:hypothetical protein
MSAPPDSDEDTPMEVTAEAEVTTEVVAAAAASEELIATLMARMLPNLQQLIISSIGQVQSLPHPEENASSPATPAPSVLRSPSTALTEPQQASQEFPRPAASLDPSDRSVDLGLLQRDLSAADTFQLDHLDDESMGFPAYDATLEPDYVPSAMSISAATPPIGDVEIHPPRAAPLPPRASPLPPRAPASSTDSSGLTVPYFGPKNTTGNATLGCIGTPPCPASCREILELPI